MSRVVRVLVTIVVVLMTFGPRLDLCAQPQSLFKSYSTLDGMPHNRVSDIYTDSEGFVWICTWYGVSRFDGYSFKNYSTMSESSSLLSHNRFLSVSEDSAHHLWFKVYNNHIYRYNRLTECFEDPVRLLEGVENKLCRVVAHRHDSKGSTWVAIPSVGLIRFDVADDGAKLLLGQIIESESIKGSIQSLWIDKENNLFVTTSLGTLYTFESQTQKFVEVGNCNSEVLSICNYKDRVCVLTSGELYFVEDAKLKCVARGERLSAMAVGGDGAQLYVGDSKGGLFRLKEGDGLLEIDYSGDRLARIRHLESDSYGIVWITTAEAGISRFNPTDGSCKRFYHEPNTVSYNIDTIPKLVESSGRLWIKMNHYGFGYYNREQDRVEPFYNDPESPECLMTNAVVRYDVRDNVLWLSTYYERGLRRAVLLEQPAREWMVQTSVADPISNEVRALMRDSREHIWVGTKTGELLHYDKQYRLLQRYDMGSDKRVMIYAIKEDNRGRVWVGTRYDGLFVLEQRGDHYVVTKHFKHNSKDIYSLSSNHIYSIEQDQMGGIWIATYGGGVNLYDEAQNRFYHSENLFVNYPIQEADRVRWLLCDAQGRMLAGTVDGLLIFTPSDALRKVEFKFVQRTTDKRESLSNNDIIHMLLDSKRRVWLATYGGGLNMIEGYDDGEPRFKSYTTDSGLASNICMAVTEDSLGHIWVSTQNGVSKLNVDKGQFSNYQLYTNHATASFNEATSLTSPSGEILFGSGDKIFAFDPQRAEPQTSDLKLHFTQLTINNLPAKIGPGEPLEESIVEAKRIELDYDYSNFRIDFAALDYASQGELGYIYMLEGYDFDWNVVGKRNTASYSNVPAGRYTFRLKAYLGSPTNPSAERHIEVVVNPPLWLTWWAKLLYVLAFLAVVMTLWRIFSQMQRMRREARVEQEMTDMKLQFFTNISHELRTPLTLILGGVEDVRKHDVLSEAGSVSLNLAHKNTQRMLSMINQLLDFRKIVKNKMELKISKVNLVQLVEDAIENFRERASKRHIELYFTVSRRSILVWVDLERMESVVYNLLSNAFKFTRNGGRIEVVLKVSQSDESVEMWVRDNGVGIPRDQQTAIFERFHQASRSVEDSIKGSGIGLSLCKEIINLHHGEISVESRMGEGATFKVKLRMGNSHFVEEQIAGQNSADEKRKEYMVSDFTPADEERRTDVVPSEESPLILVVDDNRELRLFMYNSLIDNYRVVEAADGVEAMERVRTTPPDIIITDLMMPNMDGIELINRIRSDFAISHIPIIMLTAKHSSDERIKAMEYGADGYITKPFSMELLLARIDNLLTMRRSLFEKFSAAQSVNKVIKIAPDEIVVTDKDEAFIKDIMEWLDENIEKSDLTIEQLATHLGLGRTTMYNKLKSMTGKSPVELIKEFRINKANMLLKTGQFSVSEVAYKVGFSDPGYFSRCFRERFKVSPAEYLKSVK